MSGTHPGDDDPFHPPDIPTEVHCLHCGREYESYLIEWRESEPGSPTPGKWCCPTPGCDGAGFGFDILPTDPEWTDPHGELEIRYSGGDDDEDEDDEEEDEENAIEIFSLESEPFDGDDIPFDEADEADEAELEIQIEFVEDAGDTEGDDGDGDDEDF